MTKITRRNTAVVLIDYQVSPEFSMQAPHSIPSHLMAPTVTCCGLTSGNRAVLSARTGVSHLQTNHPTIPAIRMNPTSHSLPRQTNARSCSHCEHPAPAAIRNIPCARVLPEGDTPSCTAALAKLLCSTIATKAFISARPGPAMAHPSVALNGLFG